MEDSLSLWSGAFADHLSFTLNSTFISTPRSHCNDGALPALPHHISNGFGQVCNTCYIIIIIIIFLLDKIHKRIEFASQTFKLLLRGFYNLFRRYKFFDVDLFELEVCTQSGIEGVISRTCVNAQDEGVGF